MENKLHHTPAQSTYSFLSLQNLIHKYLLLVTFINLLSIHGIAIVRLLDFTADGEV
jgi:hypothetical protein